MSILEQSHKAANKLTPDEVKCLLEKCVESKCESCMLFKDRLCVSTMCIAALNLISKLEEQHE